MTALAGGMQDDFPLTLTHVLRRMRSVHGASSVVTQVNGSGARTRATFAEVAARADRLGAALHGLGVAPGDRVGTFLWNSQEHLEAYYAVPCLGAVLHTLNLRLSAEQVAYTVNHARDRVLIVDQSLLGQFAEIAPLLETVERVVVVGSGGGDDPPPGALDYEELLASAAPGFDWPELDERAAAALCYTSGTTGNPKGVLYSQRSLCLHSLTMAGYDVYRLSERDRILSVVPMFHAMGWNLAYVAGLIGADLVLPRRWLQSEHLARLIAEERITASNGVPTIWMDMLRHAAEHGSDLSSLETVVCGGTQVPPVLMHEFEERHGVTVIQGWGMTETYPGAAMAQDPPRAASDAERWERRAHAGRVSPFYEIRIVADSDDVLPSDGETTGEVEIRGPMVASGYYGNAAATAERMHDGWLRTGDVGSIDERGWLRITDRAKDVIKSGGEWISSVDLESALMAHAAVSEAAVIAMPHERWSERPLACVVGSASAEELQAFLAERVAKWWLPDEYAFLDEIPKTSVGKFDKKLLRAMLAEGRLR